MTNYKACKDILQKTRQEKTRAVTEPRAIKGRQAVWDHLGMPLLSEKTT